MQATRFVWSSGITVIAAVLILLSRNSSADPPVSARESRSALRDAAVKAQDQVVATTAFKNLFNHASDADLVALKADPNLTIALYAAYRMRKSANPNLIAGSHPERLIGFLEGRSGLSCPPGWACSLVWHAPEHAANFPGVLKTYGPIGLATMVDGEEVGYPKGEVQYPSLNYPRPRSELHSVEFEGRRTDCPATINIRDGRLVIGKKSVPLDSTFLTNLHTKIQKDGLHWYSINALIGDNRTFIVLFGATNEKYPIFCLDSESGKLQWDASVWRYAAKFKSLFGDFYHVTELSTNEQSLAVFGIENGDHYAESFDIATGKSQWRFSPRLWAD